MTRCICYSLRTAARKVSAAYDEALAPTGVNIAQFALLRNVERRQPACLTDLGRRLDLDRSTLGRNVRVVERMGLVTVAAGDDQRKSMVSLTGRGAAVLQQATPLWEDCQTKIAGRLGPERLDLLNDLTRLL